MQRLLAIAFLTLKAAFRYRLVVALALILVGSVVVLPLIVKDDGTARGFTQILLTYTLTTITALLGFATLWLACGILAREVEECQMQVVATKPIARWQIWLGKWIGIMILNAFFLALAGGAVYGLLLWRAKQLPINQRTVLQNEVLIARGSVREKAMNLDAAVDKVFEERVRKSPVPAAEYASLRQQIMEMLKARFQIVRPGYSRIWSIDLGRHKDFLRDQPLFMRLKFTVAQGNPDEPRTYPTLWFTGVPGTGKVRQLELKLASDTFHEIQIPPNLFDDNGVLTIECINSSEVDMLFLLDEGMEILFREGGFGLNFLRGMLVIYCWLALLASIGLAAASFLSFPVAAFFSLGILCVGLSSSTLSQVVEEGGISGVNHDTGRIETPRFIDQLVVPLFGGMLKFVNLVRDFTPIDSLSTGRSIGWAQLGRAFGQIVVLMGGAFSLFGVISFTRRELAAAQGSQ